MFSLKAIFDYFSDIYLAITNNLFNFAISRCAPFVLMETNLLH